MLGNIHQLLPAVAGVLGVAMVSADTGYLARTGPVPLRFRLPPPPMVRQINEPFPPPFLPPYFPSPALISLPAPPMPHSPPDTAKKPDASGAPTAASNAPAVEFDTRAFVTAPGAPGAPDTIVSPQMLLKYFTATNNAGANMAGNAGSFGAPLGFTPPPVATAPTPPPSSKATYSTPP